MESTLNKTGTIDFERQLNDLQDLDYFSRIAVTVG